MVLSKDPEANCCPSGLQATDTTEFLCPCNVCSTFPVVGSHILTVLSLKPEASFCPLGLQATDTTLSVCPCNVCSTFPVTAIPYLDSCVT